MNLKRSFEHIDGNWPCHIYFSIPFTKKFREFSELILNDSFQREKIKKSSFIPESLFHISLSRSFILRYHQIQPFLNRLHSILPLKIYQIYVEIYCEYFVLYNDNKTRKFLCIPVEDRNSQISRIIEAVDIILLEFQQQKYYEVPKYHISIGSEPCPGEECSGDNENNESQNGNSKNENNQEITTVSIDNQLNESHKFTFFIDNNNNIGDNIDDNDDEDDGCSISVLLKTSEIRCKIGNDIYSREEHGFRLINNSK